MRRSTGIAGGKPGMGMHRQGKVAMHQVHFPGVHIILHDLLRGVQKELLASGALKIAIDFDDHGSRLGAKSFGRINVVNAIHGDGGRGNRGGFRRFRRCDFLGRRSFCLRLLVRRRRQQQGAAGNQGQKAGRNKRETAIHRFLRRKIAGREFQLRVSQVEMVKPNLKSPVVGVNLIALGAAGGYIVVLAEVQLCCSSSIEEKPLEGVSSETNLKFCAYWRKGMGKTPVSYYKWYLYRRYQIT